MSTRVSMWAALLVLVGSLISKDAAACTCVNMGSLSATVKHHFQTKAEIFSARVVLVDSTQDSRKAVAELEILEVWKGSLSAGDHIKVSVMPKEGGVSCAYTAAVGQELIAYASSSPPLGLSICNTSRIFDSRYSAKELRLLTKWRKKLAKRSESAVVELPNTSLERRCER